MYPLSHRDICGSLGELDIAAETLLRLVCPCTAISHSAKLPLVFL